MNRKEGYSGIDSFRLIAAFLVVAIHTSPLASFQATGDFILTRIFARVAVPFFFVTSGFFLISRYSPSAEKLLTFIKKTALLYGISILLYLPLNVYNGYFGMDNFLPNLIKDLIFNGTLYHLWYFPSSMLGAAIAWYLVKRVSYRGAFMITLLLYGIGLLGDSYYGIAEGFSGLKALFGQLFQVMDYTRNGFFFAPIFFLLGGYMADSRKRLLPVKSTLGLGVSLILMLSEALVLHYFKVQRHDSMYVFLLPVMYFLFQFLLPFKRGRKTGLRTTALIIYILHPLFIVLIRLLAKITGMQAFLVDNSLIHYLAVCVISLTAGILLTMLFEKRKEGKSESSITTERAWLEINLRNLAHNVKTLQAAMPAGCKMMAVVKAEGYGHGMYEITTCLDRLGVSAFAVATIEEGIRLRKYGIRGEILILGYTSPNRAKELCKYRLTQTLIDYRYAKVLNKQGYRIKAQIKTDTGMHRLGFDPEKPEEIREAFLLEHLKITGVFTHLCCADSQRKEDIAFTCGQIDTFYRVLEELKEGGIRIPKIHIQSSYGLLNYPELECDYVRTGIAMYGVLSAPADRTRLELDLRPVLSLKARVVLLRHIRAGESVGYGRAFTAERDSQIAILPIGYADGFPRNMSCGNSFVLICGQRAAVIGRICMDQLAVDVTDIPGVRIGSIATLIGRDGKEEIMAPVAAENAESITNELLSRMGRRLMLDII